MPRKRTYRATKIQSLDIEQLSSQLPAGMPLTVGVDVAKRKMLVNIAGPDNETLKVVRFEHPTETSRFLDIVERLAQAGHEPAVVMEPTGTYGDAIRYQLGQRKVPVYRVSTKRVYDAKEVYDGVPSKHDGKDACVISWLHSIGRSELWTPTEASQRSLRGLIAQRDVYHGQVVRLRGQLEAFLARHFPELGGFFDVSTRKTPLVLLAEWPSPKDLAEAGSVEVAALIRRASRRPADEAMVEELVSAAGSSIGVPMVEEERELLKTIADELLRHRDLLADVDRRVATAGAREPATSAMREMLGAVTAAVVVAYMGSPADYESAAAFEMGSPADYESAAAFEKAVGLNLTEHSSGTRKGGLHISKRGPSRVRHYLFLAAMRLVQTDAVVGAWYQRRRAYGAEARMKALIAVVRKLARALVHVARGEAFDATKLFDVRRLADTPTVCEAA